MRIILPLLIFMSAIHSNAQADTVLATKDSLHYKIRFFRMYPVIYNNELELKKGEAKALFSKVPEAIEHYRKYVNRHKISLYSYAGIFLGLSASSISFDSGNKGLGAIGLTTAIASFYTAIYFAVSSNAKLRKAIKAYNQYAVRY